MILQIANALAPDLLQTCQQHAASPQRFVNGNATAGWHARARKHNLQARPDRELTALWDQVEKAVLGNELVQAAGRPASIIRMLLSRYEIGMQYGTHVDDAIMDRQRTDLSFTLFLSPLQDYDGGELVIDEPSAERAFRLEAGSMLLYPSTTLHRVEPVTRGTRLVIVGWMRSQVRSSEAREILFDLERSISALRGLSEQAGTLELLLKTRSNLLRMWAE